MTQRKKDPALLPDALPRLISSYELRRREPHSPEQWSLYIDQGLIELWSVVSGKDAWERVKGRAESIDLSGHQDVNSLTGMARQDSELLLVVQYADAAAHVKLDEVIIDQARDMGILMDYSQIVRWRKFCWMHESDGRTLTRYHKAIEEAGRVRRREKAAPLDDPALKELKKQTVAELSIVFRKVRKITKKIYKTEAILSTFLGEFVSASEGLAQIHCNLDSWLQFFEAVLIDANHPDHIHVRQMLLGGRPQPGSLCDAWLAWSKGYRSSEVVRQAVSRIPKL